MENKELVREALEARKQSYCPIPALRWEQRFYAGTEQFFAAAMLKTRRTGEQAVRSGRRC